MKRCRVLLMILLLCICFVPIFIDEEAYAAYKLNQKAYSKIKGKWYTQASSGGYDVKFSRTKIKYYDRSTGKIDHTGKICGCKTSKKGYLIKIKYKGNKYSYYLPKKSAKGLDFYGDWKRDGYVYSGSSSLSLGKWE